MDVCAALTMFHSSCIPSEAVDRLAVDMPHSHSSVVLWTLGLPAISLFIACCLDISDVLHCDAEHVE